MDQIPKPDEGRPTPPATLESKCRLMDELFQKHMLTRLEFDVPDVGYYSASYMPVAHVKRRSSDTDQLIHPMILCWKYDEVTQQFVRELSQELSKPLNIHMSMSRTSGFNYRLKVKENVVISRLLVDPRDINEAINLLIDESNRFYILYCHTS